MQMSSSKNTVIIEVSTITYLHFKLGNIANSFLNL